MLVSLLWILLVGFWAGQFAAKLQIPPLVGMIVAGLALGPLSLDVLSDDFLAIADDLRTVAVMVILAKAGLGLDYKKLVRQGSVALRLGCLPALCEMGVVAIAALWIFDFNLGTGLLLGCVLAAESPAVIVPGMLALKERGWGVKKGIPDAILTGSALSDVLILLLFNLLVHFLAQSSALTSINVSSASLTSLHRLPLQVLLQVCGGVVVGLLTALVLQQILKSKAWVKQITPATLIVACVALGIIVLADQWNIFSGYLAVMTLGFYLATRLPPLARTLRRGFDSLWAIAQIILFVLLGSSIPLEVLSDNLGQGLLIILLGTVLGRGLGWYLSTLNSDWTPQERLYLLAGNSAKATVQAAIGAIPLGLGLPGGDIILALSALSIVVTAPLGAWAIPFFAQRLLSQDPIDPTQVTKIPDSHSLVAVSCSVNAERILKKAAEFARQTNGTLIVFHVESEQSPEAHGVSLAQVQAWVALHLKDIPYQWQVQPGEILPQLLKAVQVHRVNQVMIGQGQQDSKSLLVQQMIEQSSINVLVIGHGERRTTL